MHEMLQGSDWMIMLLVLDSSQLTRRLNPMPMVTGPTEAVQRQVDQKLFFPQRQYSMSRLVCRCTVWLIAILAVHGQGPPMGQTALRVAAWTSNGERLEKIWVVVSSLDGREKYTGNGRDVELPVPTGEYMLQVEAPGFQSKRQILKAYQPAVFRSVTLPVVWLHGQTRSRLSGKVVGYKGELSTVRVRLMALYGSEVMEAVPDRQGSVSFPADPGIYALVTVVDKEHGAVVADWREIRVTGAEIVMIDLSRYPDRESQPRRQR
jgi:hypothetical protein